MGDDDVVATSKAILARASAARVRHGSDRTLGDRARATRGGIEGRTCASCTRVL